MPAERLVNKNQKRMVLACFKAEIPCRIISREMDIPLAKVLYWEKLFQKGNWTWAKESDPALLLRQRAFELFSQGFGYKRVATLLNLPQSRVKYWQLLFQANLHLPLQPKIYRPPTGASMPFRSICRLQTPVLPRKLSRDLCKAEILTHPSEV